MAETKTIEQSLMEATGLTRKPSEDDAKWRARLVRAATEVSEKEWDNIPEPAQNWVNAGIDALNLKKDVDPFPDAEKKVARKAVAKPVAEEEETEEEAEEDPDAEAEPELDGSGETAAEQEEEETEEAEEEEEKPKPAPKPAAKPAKPAPKPAAEETAKPAKKRGGIDALRRLILTNPTKTHDEIVEALQAEGFNLSPSTTAVAFYDVHATIRIAAEEKIDLQKFVKALEKPKATK